MYRPSRIRSCIATLNSIRPTSRNLCCLAAAFVLSGWNGCQPSDGGWWNTGEYRVGWFDVVEALGRLDSQHQAAFLGYAT